MRWRLLFAAAFLTPLIGLSVADYWYSGRAPGLFMVPIALAFAFAGAAELTALLPERLRPRKWLVATASCLIVLASAAPAVWGVLGRDYPLDCPLGKLGWPLGATALMVTVFLIEEMRCFDPGYSAHVTRLALATFTAVYTGLFLGFLYPLRTFGGNELGMVALLSMLVVVKVSDTGAYTAGKLFGRHRLAPRLSPGKTIEGALGGIVSAIAVSWFYFDWFAPWLVTGELEIAAWRSVVYGLVLGVAAIVGDLSESLIKRDLRHKDSSHWLPGLGGILDLLDSVIVATPTAYLCWSVGLVGK